ncbi:hypothetical protein ACRALDRAFT_212437 [Sodiomyces alcalophilus JCM 7366]|uniref:uncharacterized protein n=1 Tax=Sodiomyces alcalophilus JCM 7366 TaxID=591952 RepID=UPI0039B4B362
MTIACGQSELTCPRLESKNSLASHEERISPESPCTNSRRYFETASDRRHNASPIGLTFSRNILHLRPSAYETHSEFRVIDLHAMLWLSLASTYSRTLRVSRRKKYIRRRLSRYTHHSYHGPVSTDIDDLPSGTEEEAKSSPNATSYDAYRYPRESQPSQLCLGSVGCHSRSDGLYSGRGTAGKTQGLTCCVRTAEQKFHARRKKKRKDTTSTTYVHALLSNVVVSTTYNGTRLGYPFIVSQHQNRREQIGVQFALIVRGRKAGFAMSSRPPEAFPAPTTRSYVVLGARTLALVIPVNSACDRGDSLDVEVQRMPRCLPMAILSRYQSRDLDNLPRAVRLVRILTDVVTTHNSLSNYILNAVAVAGAPSPTCNVGLSSVPAGDHTTVSCGRRGHGEGFVGIQSMGDHPHAGEATTYKILSLYFMIFSAALSLSSSLLRALRAQAGGVHFSLTCLLFDIISQETRSKEMGLVSFPVGSRFVFFSTHETIRLCRRSWAPRNAIGATISGRSGFRRVVVAITDSERWQHYGMPRFPPQSHCINTRLSNGTLKTWKTLYQQGKHPEHYVVCMYSPGAVNPSSLRPLHDKNKGPSEPQDTNCQELVGKLNDGERKPMLHRQQPRSRDKTNYGNSKHTPEIVMDYENAMVATKKENPPADWCRTSSDMIDVACPDLFWYRALKPSERDMFNVGPTTYNVRSISNIFASVRCMDTNTNLWFLTTYLAGQADRRTGGRSRTASCSISAVRMSKLASAHTRPTKDRLEDSGDYSAGLLPDRNKCLRQKVEGTDGRIKHVDWPAHYPSAFTRQIHEPADKIVSSWPPTSGCRVLKGHANPTRLGNTAPYCFPHAQGRP